MPDLSSFDLADAFGKRGCPMCRVLAEGERREIAGFAREGRFAPQARGRFRHAGGYCRRHAWLLHTIAAGTRHGMVIVDLYEGLIASDRLRIGDVLARIVQPRGRKRLTVFPRTARCPACVEDEARLERKCVFLLDLLREPGGWGAYARSDGLCLPHLGRVVEAAAADFSELARALLADGDRRLAELADDLAEFDRKRDYRYADEPKGKEQESWTHAVARYAGEPD